MYTYNDVNELISFNKTASDYKNQVKALIENSLGTCSTCLNDVNELISFNKVSSDYKSQVAALAKCLYHSNGEREFLFL